MTSLATLADCLRNGIHLIRQAAELTGDNNRDRGGTAGTRTADSPRLEDLFDPDDAASLHRLANIYYGHTPYTGYQRQAIAAATTQQHSIGDLLRIEHHTRRLRDSRHVWNLRTHLCGVPGTDIDTEATAKLKELLPAPAPKRLGITHYRGKDGNPDTLIYRGPSLEVTRLRDFLDHPDATTTGAPAESFLPPHATGSTPAVTRTTSTGTAGHRYALGDSRNTTPEAAPHIILTLDDVIALQHNNTDSNGTDGDTSDNDVILTLTNGARITGAEWAAIKLHEIGFVTLLHPVEGPVNLYRTSRFPNMKQRLMAAAEHPLCAWPGCRQAASRSQIHHLTAWKHGGQTNAKNLTVLCAYHNGINNDDPAGHVSAEDTQTAPELASGTPVGKDAADRANPPDRAKPSGSRSRKASRGRIQRHPGGVTWVQAGHCSP